MMFILIHVHNVTSYIIIIVVCNLKLSPLWIDVIITIIIITALQNAQRGKKMGLAVISSDEARLVQTEGQPDQTGSLDTN